MVQYRPVTVTWEGRKYAASFEIQGGEVCVQSAYGSKRGQIGKLKAKALAEKLLLDLAKASEK